ncbi:MAG: ATP-NAD kinase family protein [Caldiserica bacterium]|jgi:predicted polyphosphate/ATP-dependent NAD kinase|nr:ATP-NAD kinase family protein [Caldisericota bacterium]
MKKKLGLIVNPVAGMGGKLGFKGTDGAEILSRCRQMNATPESPLKARDALKKLLPIKDELEIITYPLEMGEIEAREAGFQPTVIGEIKPGETTPEDTRKAAKEIASKNVDLLLFAGGDGTARDVYSVVKDQVVALGIPAGVKIHSAVFGVNPRRAGEVALMFLQGKIKNVRLAEVMDIDEDAFRQGRVSAALYGYLKIPHEQNLVQGMKSGRAVNEDLEAENIAFYILDQMEPESIYILGPGTTLFQIKKKIGDKGTLLGVDVVKNKQFIATDVNEKQLIEILDGKKAYIVVTVIGGQGYIFGRGNQQLSPAVIKKVGKENIIVVATRDKIAAFGEKPLLVDTGDEETDKYLSGYIRVITSYHEQRLMKVEY